jgi:glutamine synthetase
LVADPQECIDFLAAHPQVKYVDVFFTSMTGVPRGKRLRIHELQAIYEYGRFLPGSILVVDTNGADCEDTGLVWEDGDADRRARPVPGTLTLAPWLGPDMAQVMLSLYELDGAANDLDPRHVLKRVLDRFAADGLTPVAACELEYYLVDQHRGPGGELLPARSLQTGERPQGIQVYGLPELEAISPFLRELWDTCDVLGVPLEGAISEFAPGQVELTLKHKPDALECRRRRPALQAGRQGRGPAPWLRGHLHGQALGRPGRQRLPRPCQLQRRRGSNLCAADDPEGSALLKHAIGGMKVLMAECMAILAPNANSYRRFKANSYAPVAPTWGVNNRTVSLRVPAGPPPTRHVEHRVAGADANPYLVLAVLLACAHHGITNKIDPGPAVVGDGYAAAAKEKIRLPTDWYAAVNLFEASDVLRDYLGERFVEMFVSVKRTEQARFAEVVTQLDYDWYLRNA